MYIRFICGIGLIFLISGCKIASYDPVDLYQGANRPDNELAIIGQCSWCFPREKSVDGGQLFVTNLGRVLPGKHVLSVKLYPAFGQGNYKPAVFEIKVEAGHKYLVSSMVLNRNSKQWCESGLLPEKLSSSDEKTFIWLEDQMTGEVAGGHRPWIDAKIRIVKDFRRLQYWPQNQTENRTRPEGLEEFTVCRGSKLNISRWKDFRNYGEGIIPEKSVRDIDNLYFYANWDEGLEGH